MALIAQAATLEAAHPVHPLLRRVPHFARSRQGRAIDRRRYAGHADVRSRSARIATAPSPPTPRSSAAPPRTPTSTSRRARRSTPSTDACPAIVEKAMDRFADSRRPHIQPVRLRRRAGRRARDHPDGLGRRSRRTRPSITWSPRGEKVGVLKVRLFRPFSMEHFLAALPDHRQVNRRARPHQRAGQRRRTPLSGRHHRAWPKRSPPARCPSRHA